MTIRPLLAIALILLLQASIAARVKVACIGNSITYGLTLDNPATQSYPAQLQKLLGDDFDVANFGHSGATLLNNGHRPYMQLPEFRKSMEFKPDIALIHLGINDTDPRNWPIYGHRFINDYKALVDSLRRANPDVRIIIANLTPIGAKHPRFRSGTRQWRDEIRRAIAHVAVATKAQLIDFDTPLHHRPDLMPDAVHPNAEGSLLLARTAAQAITGNYGGLQLPPIYQSGMVLQRDRYLTIRGTADANTDISLTIDGRQHHATADGGGKWAVTIPPLTADRVYSMTVTDNHSTIRLDDILAGEVWIASGQSNMEFPLRDAIGSANDITTSADSALRFYNMVPIATTYDVEWTDSIKSLTNRLQFYNPAVWQPASPQTTPDISAVAYYFARQLRDSLGVPVGVISNAVGGSTCESWIDISTLQRQMPEILLNWRSNDYVQPWAQQRAARNTGPADPLARHPFEPSYLFASAIQPLEGFTPAGIIWYQGESNAHNTYIHEALFPMLVDSWRAHFADPSLPIVYAQLSSIDRPSWPLFRDSQRRLQSIIPRAWMAVTSDIGDSTDVHPRLKRPVGQRMARQALNHIYGFESLTPSGPQPATARRHNSAIILTFDNADTLLTADGSLPISFEIAAADSIFLPARAEIIGHNQLKISNMDIKSPRYVRYGWQPFTRANLINSDSLPASTFSIEAAGDDDLTPESGIECGLSGAFAGLIGSDLIIAGGCNFPIEPLAPSSKKKFYRGIYAADTTDAQLQWRRIGSLEAPIAYGATASTPDGMVLIGGTPDGVPTADVVMLSTTPDGLASLSPLPSLPATIDNAAATAIGRKIYLAGGNLDGTPSTSLYMLDLDDTPRRWRTLKQIPGAPRVQPVMAAAPDKSGEICLYLWGGFAPRHQNTEPSLQLDGLVYTPSKNNWKKISSPLLDPESQSLSVGGGTACTIADGRIAIAGGVNKDIFLEALRNQAPDYLTHPIEWYRFNPHILIFDPKTQSWSIKLTTPQAARAGASLIATPGALYLYGGELKPRIRTASTIRIEL